MKRFSATILVALLGVFISRLVRQHIRLQILQYEFAMLEIKHMSLEFQIESLRLHEDTNNKHHNEMDRLLDERITFLRDIKSNSPVS